MLLSLPRCVFHDNRGAVLIEAAIAFPILIVMLLGIVSYGEWFFISHSIQAAANEAARSAVAGLDRTERYNAVLAVVRDNIASSGSLNPAKIAVVVEDDDRSIVVRLTYDSINDPLLASNLIPLPTRTIRRSASVLLREV